MHTEITNWVQQSNLMRAGLEQWLLSVNSQNPERVVALYHPKARVFPTFGAMKQGSEAIEAYYNSADIFRVQINYGSLSYNPDDRLIEGEYTYQLLNGGQLSASFAFKFSREGLILEHASAPKNINSWRVRNEVNICTLLTAATVRSILKREPVESVV